MREFIEKRLEEARRELGEPAFSEWAQGFLRPLAMEERLRQAREAEGIGNSREAIRLYEDALNLTKTLPDRRAEILSRLGIALRQGGEFSRAVSVLEGAFRALSLVAPGEQKATICLEQARVARTLDRFEEALLHYFDAYRFFKQAGDELGMALVNEELGILELTLRMIPDAIRELQEALEIYLRLGQETRASIVEGALQDAHHLHP